VIDQGLKRAIFITFVVVIVAKFASAFFDVWMGDTQDEMIANQETFKKHHRGLAVSHNAARTQAIVAENCRKLMSTRLCAHPKNLREAGECLLNLNMGSCDLLPRVQLCAAVEELRLCSDIFEDQKENGCDRLRRNADCKVKPAPENRENLWKIKLDDGMWHGND